MIMALSPFYCTICQRCMRCRFLSWTTVIRAAAAAVATIQPRNDVYLFLTRLPFRFMLMAKIFVSIVLCLASLCSHSSSASISCASFVHFSVSVRDQRAIMCCKLISILRKHRKKNRNYGKHIHMHLDF